MVGKFAKAAIPENDQRLVNEIEEVQEWLTQVEEEMERFYELAPKVKRYFELYRQELLENRRSPKYVVDVLTGEEVVESHLVRRSFRRFDTQIYGDVAKFNYPLNHFRTRMKLLQYEAIRRGVSLPNTEQPDLSNSQSNKNSGVQPKPLAQFPSPPDLEWGEVTIAFISDEKIKVRAKGQMKDYSFNRIGFDDKRTGKPNVLWWLLRGLAWKKGRASWEDLKTQSEDLGDRNKLQSKVSRLRTALNAFMDMDDDPFKPYKEVKAYETKFKLKNKISDDLYDEGPSDIDEVFSEETNRSH